MNCCFLSFRSWSIPGFEKLIVWMSLEVLKLHYLFTFVWICAHAHYSDDVEIRGLSGPSVLPFHHAGSRDWTQIIRPGGKHLCLRAISLLLCWVSWWTVSGWMTAVASASLGTWHQQWTPTSWTLHFPSSCNAEYRFLAYKSIWKEKNHHTPYIMTAHNILIFVFIL